MLSVSSSGGLLPEGRGTGAEHHCKAGRVLSLRTCPHCTWAREAEQLWAVARLSLQSTPPDKLMGMKQLQFLAVKSSPWVGVHISRYMACYRHVAQTGARNETLSLEAAAKQRREEPLLRVPAGFSQQLPVSVSWPCTASFTPRGWGGCATDSERYQYKYFLLICHRHAC